MFRRTQAVTCLVLLSASLLALAPPSRAQSGSTTAQEADASFLAKDWAKAAQLYDNLTKTEPKNRRNWYRLGIALQFHTVLRQALHSRGKQATK